MIEYDFSKFPNVELIHVNINDFNDLEKQILFRQAEFRQAMVDKDIKTLKKLTSPDKTFVHMSGKVQTRDEFFNDISNQQLQYFSIGIDSPVIFVDDQFGLIKFTSVLNAKAYGAKGIYHMPSSHYYENQNGQWINVNQPVK